ncbi:hypothetical protein [Roseibium sp.]|uniref:hypothetical protein n=1 Tax=Roseibium sp. TaxID=1936156 RepID=UPI003BB173C3
MAGQRKWSFDKVRESASHYQSRKDFRLGAPQAYSAATRYGWLNRVCDHMDTTRIDWTFEECQRLARKYKCKSAFMLDANPAYQSAYRKGWLDKICEHM